jgi:flagellar M-ring protein FliF
MDNAVATNPPLLVPVASTGGAAMAQRWQTLPGRTKLLAGLGVVALIAVLALMFTGTRNNDYKALFANLSEKDGGQIIDKLAQMNVPYRFSEGGTSIMVPAAKVPELRMKLAAAGLPSGSAAGASGYELLDKNTFGQTQGQERMKMQRAIEGELTTSIQSLEGVKTARVHLALPQQNGFFREQQKPTASVVLTLHPGRSLDRGQIAGIVRVVSGSVPELTAKTVSVVDSTGALLSSTHDDDNNQALDAQQLQYRRDLEASHLRRVMDLLEPVMGRDNVRASVTADIDFSQVMKTDEAYRPNQGADTKAAVREQRSEESNQPNGTGVGGIPGATSNQPPVGATAPINAPAQTLQSAQGGAAGAVGAGRREAATRYEVDKTVTVTRNSTGTVRRLNAAVVVNHRAGTSAKGKPITVPLSDKEIEQLTALVQQGIGFNAERGDMVKLINAPFKVETPAPVEDLPLWKQPGTLDLLKTTATPLALGLVALVIVLALIRPAVSALVTPPAPPEALPGSSLNEVVDGGTELPAPDSPALLTDARNDKLAAARAIAKANPAAVAQIVQTWVNGPAA